MVSLPVLYLPIATFSQSTKKKMYVPFSFHMNEKVHAIVRVLQKGHFAFYLEKGNLTACRTLPIPTVS